jgi:hypothetical protein
LKAFALYMRVDWRPIAIVPYAASSGSNTCK